MIDAEHANRTGDYSLLAQCSGKRVAIDTETTGLYWWKNDLIGVSVYCPDADFEAYFPCEPNTTNSMKLKNAVAELLKPDTWVFMHNAKFDMHFLDLSPRKSGWQIMDTTILVHLFDSRMKKNLEKAEQYFLSRGTKKMHVDEAPYKLKNKPWLWNIDLLSRYAINDTRVTYRLAEHLAPVVDELGLWDLALSEMEFLKIIWETERHGMLMDRGFMATAKASLQERLEVLEVELIDELGVGPDFNWRSHKQLSEALYEGLDFPRPKNPFADADGVDRSKFAAKGMYNKSMTSTFILMEKAHHPLGELVSSIRETYKLIRSYITQWETLLGEGNDIIHPNFNLTGTRTGRLSSSKPNMQNLPSFARGRFTQSTYSGSMERTEEYNLRSAFTSRPDYSLVAVDHKQMELRMLAILTQDPNMLTSLNAGRDVHADVAERIWGTRDKVSREHAKTVSFGMCYGMTTGSLQHRLGMTHQESKDTVESYFKAFPNIQKFLFAQQPECMKYGYLRYWNNRIWREDNPSFMYKGANARIQGGCAGILAVAAVRTADWIQQNNLQQIAHIVNYVHDELIIEVPDDFVTEAARKLTDIMRLEDIFDVPWFSDTKVGKTYGDMDDWNVGAGILETRSEEERFFSQEGTVRA